MYREDECFDTPEGLVTFARWFIWERIRSLENDVNACLNPSSRYQPAPFAAVLSCFAVIDLLGSLLTGEIEKTSKNIKKFLTKYMSYKEDVAELMTNVYRHKLVHQHQPTIIYKYKDKYVSWQIWNVKHPLHKELVPLRVEWKPYDFYPKYIPLPKILKELSEQLKKQGPIQILIISIPKMLEEIKKGAEKYLNELQSSDPESDLRHCFCKALRKMLYRETQNY